MLIIAAMLICCSVSLDTISPTQLVCGENLTHPEPQNIGESWADLRLPFYTSGFE